MMAGTAKQHIRDPTLAALLAAVVSHRVSSARPDIQHIFLSVRSTHIYASCPCTWVALHTPHSVSAATYTWTHLPTRSKIFSVLPPVTPFTLTLLEPFSAEQVGRLSETESFRFIRVAIRDAWKVGPHCIPCACRQTHRTYPNAAWLRQL